MKLTHLVDAIQFENDSEMRHSPTGKIQYRSPEQMKMKSYKYDCDQWSLAIMMYTLLTGVMPFDARTDKEIKDAVIMGEFNFPDDFKTTPISMEAKDLIRSLTFCK
jgi:serine/threonine protein kinase